MSFKDHLDRRDAAAFERGALADKSNSLTDAAKWIDGEAPAKEPPARPTVGLPTLRDPEQDDGNEVVLEAFNEGIMRGLWLAADKVRRASHGR